MFLTPGKECDDDDDAMMTMMMATISGFLHVQTWLPKQAIEIKIKIKT